MARSQDLRYRVSVQATVKDATKRLYFSGVDLQFVGAWAEFGQDYVQYVSECLKKVIGGMPKKVKMRLAPGEAQEHPGLDAVASTIRQLIEERSPATAPAIAAAMKVHGVEAVSRAISGKSIR